MTPRCRDCKHLRLSWIDWLIGFLEGNRFQFAKCAVSIKPEGAAGRPVYSMYYCVTERKFDHRPQHCGPAGRNFKAKKT